MAIVLTRRQDAPPDDGETVRCGRLQELARIGKSVARELQECRRYVFCVKGRDRTPQTLVCLQKKLHMAIRKV